MNKNDKIIKQVKANLEIEGLFLEKDGENLINNFLNHEITCKQGIEIIKNEFKTKEKI